MKKRILTGLVVVAMGATQLNAQNWTVGYNLGRWDMRTPYYKGLTSNAGLTTNPFKADLDSMGGFAEIVGGYRFGKGLSVNVPLRMGTVGNPARPVGGNGFGMFGADAVLQLAFEHGKQLIVPYLSAGLGFNRINSENIFNAPLGAGLKFRLGTGTYLNVESGLRKAFSDNRDNWQHKIGLNFRFDQGDASATTQVDEVKKMEVIKRDVVKKSDADIAAEAKAAAEAAAAKAKLDAAMATARAAEAAAQAKADAAAAKAKADADAAAIRAKATADAAAAIAQAKADADARAAAAKATADAAAAKAKAEAEARAAAAKATEVTTTTTTTTAPVQVTQETAQVMTEAMEGVQFETGSATIKASSYAILNKVVSIMSKNPSYNLSISGHTDNTGNESANQRLSEQRARACMNYLVTKGISAKRLSAAGYGSTQPRADNGTATGRAQNRRVEFNVR